MFVVRRSEHNPILMPHPQHPWETKAVFNWCPVHGEDAVHVLYRAMANEEIMGDTNLSLSTIGHTESSDGIHFGKRRQLIVPEHDWERYGCEDPRVTKFEDTYYIFYTALGTYPFSAEGIRIGLARSKDCTTIEDKHLVTPFNAKAMALFPKRIDGKLWAVLSVDTDKPPAPAHIAFASFDTPEDLWNEEKWQAWYGDLSQHAIDVRRSESDQVEVGAPPIETEHGWLLIYSHIQHYFEGRPVFGVEALLLDKNNPQHIIGQTRGPILVPETLYEKQGIAANIVFPSGALIEPATQNNDEDVLTIYYGAADTTCCTASVPLKPLLETLTPESEEPVVTRFDDNPILEPMEEHAWESRGVFNPAAIDLEGTVHLLYRAQGEDYVSRIGYATSHDGKHIDERLPEPIYSPRESFETKGCEDPRLIEVGDKIYMFYTAFDGEHQPRVAISSIKKESFLAREWTWTRPEVITPPGIMDKDAAIFPETFDGKYLFLHRVQDVICADEFESLEFSRERVKRCIPIFGPRSGMWDSAKVGIAGPPLKTDDGWLLFYHGVSEKTKYRVGAVLLEQEDPTSIIGRTTVPILEPEMSYELEGQVPHVVFPCGNILRDDTVLVYYGGADKVVAGAEVSLSQLLAILKR